MRWEYKSVVLPQGCDMVAGLIELGCVGWELAHTQVRDGWSGPETVCLLKRSAQDKQAVAEQFKFSSGEPDKEGDDGAPLGVVGNEVLPVGPAADAYLKIAERHGVTRQLVKEVALGVAYGAERPDAPWSVDNAWGARVRTLDSAIRIVVAARPRDAGKLANALRDLKAVALQQRATEAGRRVAVGGGMERAARIVAGARGMLEPGLEGAPESPERIALLQRGMDLACLELEKMIRRAMVEPGASPT